jgi:uncharacterized iron-regulated membrane protein
VKGEFNMSIQAQELQQSVVEDEFKENGSKATSLFRAVWRWHFYAGIIFAPFIIMLSLSGIIYLFKPQIENMMYKDYYFVHTGQEKLAVEKQIEQVKEKYPKATIADYKPSFEKNRSSEIGIMNNDVKKTIFMNPYNGKILGGLSEDDKLFNKIRSLHGELMAGKLGDRIVEMSACWAIILLITGLYLWFPRTKDKIMGTIVPRLFKGKRILLRDLHSVPAFWFSFFISIFILTGIPWSGLSGDYINRFATATHTGYPTGLWDGNVPKSVVPTKDIAKVPWAAENLPVPKSKQTDTSTLSIEKIMNIVDKKNVEKGYRITFPEGKEGVYTVAVFPEDPKKEATLHIDQYSGKVLADLRFADYGSLAKAIEIGIALHEGHYFGLANQLLDCLICLVLIGVCVTGVYMWWKRKPKGKLGAPTLPKDFKLLKGVAILIIILGIVFPLVGISLLAALILDWLIIKRIRPLKQWIG